MQRGAGRWGAAGRGSGIQAGLCERRGELGVCSPMGRGDTGGGERPKLMMQEGERA